MDREQVTAKETNGGQNEQCEKEEAEEEDGGGQANPATLALYDERKKLEDNRCLLEELAVIESGLRESVRLDVERQKEMEFIRQQDNKTRWQSLRYLQLNQRVNKAFVSSYFRKFPMHIYCLPIENKAQRTRKKMKRKT